VLLALAYSLGPVVFGFAIFMAGFVILIAALAFARARALVFVMTGSPFSQSACNQFSPVVGLIPRYY
jgi:hypothetical protein